MHVSRGFDHKGTPAWLVVVSTPGPGPSSPGHRAQQESWDLLPQRPRHSQAFGADIRRRWGFQHPPGKSLGHRRPLPAGSSPTQPRPSPLVGQGGHATWRRRKTLPMSPNSRSPLPGANTQALSPPLALANLTPLPATCSARHSFLPHPLPPPWPHSGSGLLRDVLESHVGWGYRELTSVPSTSSSKGPG